uniref:DUF295 domain-containing protein n=1 Tax=Oryza glumipatula TaxID=40148 RepID=A0A0E0AUD1_9ORYZ
MCFQDFDGKKIGTPLSTGDHFNESLAWRTVCDIPPEAGLRLLGGIAVSSCRASACNLKRNHTYFMMKNFRENDGDLCRP